MTGTLTQIVALTCYANALLSGEKVEKFFPDNSAFKFCESVRFVTLEPAAGAKPKEVEIAKTPDEWFAYLKMRNARGVQLHLTKANDPRIPDRIAAAFVGGGGTWAMEVFLPDDRSEQWIARWDAGNPKAPDQRVWRVTYGRIAELKATPAKQADLAKVAKELDQALREAREFSKKQKLVGFEKMFANALETLDSKGEKLKSKQKDFPPAGNLPLEAKTLLDACQSAWVFGGMGSWNDLIFKGEEGKEYNRISDHLYNSINQAIESATNTSFRAAKSK